MITINMNVPLIHCVLLFFVLFITPLYFPAFTLCLLAAPNLILVSVYSKKNDLPFDISIVQINKTNTLETEKTMAVRTSSAEIFSKP